MKKTLVALAALAATSAFAQSSVTIYGIADVAYVNKTHTNLNGTVASKTSGVSEGANAGNRIGFRGVEDLGGGMKANFVIENGINITNGQLFSSRAAAAGQQIDGISASGNMPTGAYSTGTNRQAYVGASGGFGEVRLGYQYTALYTVSTLSGYHVGSEQPGGDLAHGTLSNADFGGTRANGITYIAPKMGAVTLTLQKGAASGREDVEATAPANLRSTDNNNRWSLLANYAAGPLNASYARTSMKVEQSAASNLTGYATNIFGALNATAYSATTGAAKSQSNTLDQLGASYTVGALKLVATIANGKITDTATVANTSKTSAQQIGAEYTMGKARPFFTTGSAVVKNSAGTKTFDAELTQFGVRYDLSKRTTAYAMSGSTDDKAQATAANIKERKFTAIGLAHSF
jgi:predicted porin